MNKSIWFPCAAILSFFLISGCNTAHMGGYHQSPESIATASTEVVAPMEIHASEALPPTREAALSPERSAPDENLNSETFPLPLNKREMTPTDTETKNCSAQEQADHALELCRSAQTYWEKGDLEHALTELDTAYAVILDINLEACPQINQQKEDLRYLISKRILEIYASRNIVVNGEHDAIPLILNSHVQSEIKRFTGPEKYFFIQSMRRAGRYRPYIISELKKAGLPEELSWLPLIESGYKPKALSPARALGLWQFIPSTGYKFGLKRNYYIDERLDFEKSTRAAISYLKELHNIFGDWSTVLAAYNCGEGRVLRTIRRQNINYLDNFWDLYPKLPRETARYVPRFLAVLHIVKNLDKYDITVKDPLPPLAFKTCKIKKQIRLKDIAREIGTRENTLKMLNPELRYALLPPEEYAIRIPVSKSEIFMASLDKIKASYPPPTRYTYHRIRKGETLSGIARQYNSTVAKISRANGINRNFLIIAGKVLKIPNRNIPSAGIQQRPRTKPLKNATSYVVRRGDNLWIIARRYGSTTKRIMAANNLSSASLHIGQVLSIPAAEMVSPNANSSTYWVKSGDSPFTIAKKYNMTLRRLLSLNHLTKRSTIYPGQKLLVE